MPNFPTYYGPPLPKALNPLTPAHYWLVFKWVFFQPNRLKHYLYQIDPELYSTRSLRAVGHTLSLPAYRGLYIIAAFVLLLTAIGMALAADVSQAMPINWAGVVGGVVVGVTFGVGASMWGGVTAGVAAGVAGGVVVGVVWGVVWGVAGGVTVGEVAWSAAAWGVAVGVAVGMAFGVAGDVAWGAAIGVPWGVAFGIAWGVVFGLVSGVAFGVAAGVAGFIGGSRLLFFPFELFWVGLVRLLNRNQLQQLPSHPAFWDELAVWPLPGFCTLLRQLMDGDFEAALHVAIKVSANPFQRWAVQRALSDWLATRHDALATFQRLTNSALLDNYLSPPTERAEFRDFPSARVVLLGEIGQQPTDGQKIHQTSRAERVVWHLTHHLRRIEPTPLSQFSAMLYMILLIQPLAEKIRTFEFSLAERFSDAYEVVRVYPRGDEAANAWASLATFLDTTTLEQIGVAHQQMAWISCLEQPYLAPAVIGTLKALGDISQSVAACLQATSLPHQTVALNQAAGGLQELTSYVENELWPPERALYLALITNWQSLVAAEQGRLGESALRQMSPSERLATGLIDRTSEIWQRPARPFANPYIAGDPVMPPLFTGRRDIFTKIAEIWRAKANPDSIILYGHRRMGKSSILRNLDQAAPGRVIAYVNLQGETSFVASTSDLLLALADRVYAEVKRARPDTALTQPPADQFNTPAAAQIQFNRFMEQVRTALGDSGLILALDEFEAIEEAVHDSKVGKEIYQFLRAKTQEPWITVVFGGLHTLDEMSRDYAQPFYGSYQNIVVSYLAPDDARHLITNPTPDFTVNYELSAVDRIIAATGGQPYLIQLVCRDALDHLNHELFDEHKERQVKITLADVEAALGDDLFRRGTGYFDGVWTQVSEPAQQTLLRHVAQREAPWSLAELEAVIHVTPDVLHYHLQLAERRDILRQRDGAWEFCVPLMRRWINWKEQS